MAISAERAAKHVADQCAKLACYPRTKNWPRYLFHTANINVAREILLSGLLISRENQDILLHDVANQQAVANNPQAHKHARLYFRPMNDFHLRTEGIKCLGDPYRLDKQMSIPIMFAFDALSVLSHEGIGFTDGNLASEYTIPGFDEDYFNNIPFDLVYHDQNLPRDLIREVHYHRMAEVVFPGKLQIFPHLKRIVCRTHLDRMSLLHALGEKADEFREMTIVEQVEGSSFFRWGLFIRNLEVVEQEIFVTLHPPKDLPTSGRYEVRVRQFDGENLVLEGAGSVSTGSAKFSVRGFKQIPSAIWEVHLEEVLAFHAPAPTGKSSLY